MVRQILFVQGAGKEVHRTWDGKLVESLQRELGPRYEVRYPLMPNEADPNFTIWQMALEKELGTLQDGALVVGHSLGGTVLIHALAKSAPRVALRAIALIAAPFIGQGGWTKKDIEPLSHLGARLPPAVPVLLYHGDKDTTVPIAHVELYAAAIPRARVRRLTGRDHQLNDNLSDVASDIRELDSASRRTQVLFSPAETRPVRDPSNTG